MGNCDFHKQHVVLFLALVVFISVMSLISGDSLRGIYLSIAHILSIDPARVSGNNATTISNTGHVIASFMLSWVAFYVFRGDFIKTIGSAGTLACLIEFLQLFSATRQANWEDILLSFTGIFFATILIVVLKKKPFHTGSSNDTQII
jgi:VanZ family protein